MNTINPPLPVELDASRILIIDDTRAIHDDFHKILGRTANSDLERARFELFDRQAAQPQAASFKLDSAFQGEEGLAFVKRAVAAGHGYSLAFVDMRMPPGWDGVETIEKLWQVDPDLQIVICTAYSDQSWDTIVKRLGNGDSLLILKKPFDPVEILQLAHALTKKWLLGRQNRLRLTELESRVAGRTRELQAANQQLLQEITESRRTQEQLKLQFSALSAADNAIALADRDGKIEWVNPAFTKLTGYGADEIIGGNLREPKSRQHPPEFYAGLWATINAGKVWHGEVAGQRKDGRVYTEEMTITPVVGAGGQITHFVAIKQDITEQRQLENRLQQAQKMEAVGTLAGGIAHDFNNILTTLFGYLYLLQQAVAGNPAAQADIDEILKAAGRAKDLVQQILTFSRQRDHKRETIRLDTVVRDAAKFLRASFPAQIKIELSLPEDTPAVLADPTQIYQVTMNLATNALHAMEGRPGQLTIKLDSFVPDDKFRQTNPKCAPGRYARLTVADTGDGMDAQTLERIFEPFFTTKPVGKGTGLGLAVVHGIIQAHDGFISVESQVGKGTTFSLCLPAQMPAEKPATAARSQMPKGQGQTILLVDDEPALTKALQRLLQSLNYQVVTSNGAPEALTLFREKSGQFDVVITDLTMPEMNGLELAAQLHTIRPEVPVILASGYAPTMNREKLRAAGISEQLEKPLSMRVLADTLQRILFPKDQMNGR